MGSSQDKTAQSNGKGIVKKLPVKTSKLWSKAGKRENTEEAPTGVAAEVKKKKAIKAAKAADEKELNAISTAVKGKPPLIFLPGSSGKVGKDTKVALDYFARDFDVHILAQHEKGKGLWALNKVSSPRNTNAAINLIKLAVDLEKGLKWYLMAASFGCRVAAELVSGHCSTYNDGTTTSDVLPYFTADELPSAFVAMGIPIYADSKSRDPNERVDHFRASFPATVGTSPAQPFRVLLCSGANDSCLHSKAPHDGPTGQDLLIAQKNTWMCSHHTEIHLVPGGNHGVFDGSAKEDKCIEAYEAIMNFLKSTH